jgi:hypothetical protein
MPIITVKKRWEVEMYRNNLQFCHNEKPPTGKAEVGLKLIAEKLQFGSSLEFTWFILTIPT